MSTRQLRKLQRQKELAQVETAAPGKSEDDDEDSAEEASPVQVKPRVSLFAALGGDDDENEEEHEDEEDKDEPAPDTSVAAAEPAQSAVGSKKSKKKKKHKKNKTGQATQEKEAAAPVEDDDEIDRAIKELNLGSKQGVTASEEGNSATDRLNELLSINPYHLKAMNEMRNMFGREAMEAADAEEEQDSNNRRRRGAVQQQVDLETFLRERPGAPKLPEVTLRRNIFIQGREHWPRESAGGLTMKEVQKAPDGSWTEYAYAYDNQYEQVQAGFLMAVSTGDPMRLVHLLKQHPYHVSTLLQVSNVAKQDQNMALASELCERALFTFGRLATTSFRQNLEQGRARLDFRRPENREFWLASFRYLLSLIRKGTYRTALEWAKVMFSLDPNDPYAVRHHLHALAIKARESRWLVDFMECLETSTVDYDAFEYTRQSKVLAKLQLGDTDGAREDLTRGMQQLPWLYCALFQELNLDAPPSIWGINAQSDARAFWVKLYVSKTKDLWNNTQATALLRSVAGALPRVDVAPLPSDDRPADLAAGRLAYLEGDTSLMALVPQEILSRQPNYDSDPLPPSEAENIFSSDASRLPWHRAIVDDLLHGRLPTQQRGGMGMVAPGEEIVAEGQDDFSEIDDDEELRRDIEGQAQLGGEQGLYGSIMQVLGMLGLGANGGTQNDGGDSSRENHEDTATGGGLPGSWPEDEEEGDAANNGGQHDDDGGEHRPRR